MEPKQISCDDKFPSLSATYPWFIAQNLESGNQIIHTIGNNKQNHYQCRISELHGRRIRACFHGWVILSNHPDSVLWSLWNPLTSKLIRLPPLTHAEKRSYECCLSSPPDHQGSVFLLTTAKVHTIVFCRLDCKRKRLKWIEMSYAKQLRGISDVYLSDLVIVVDVDVEIADCFLECPTCCNSKVYALAMGRYYHFVIVVDIVIKGKEVVISLLPFVEITYSFYRRCPPTGSFRKIHDFLKGYGTELFYISVCLINETRIDDVYLFKLDFTSMTWEEMVDLKDAIFFVELASDYSACYYGSSFDSKLGGYVHILRESGKIIYSFHARDGTMSISSMPCLVRESQASAWAMLEWRLEGDHTESKQEEDKVTEVRLVKGGKTEFDIRTGEAHLLNIPIHILEMIMELCIGSEYMRFRATCKLCYLTTSSIQWSNEATLRRLQIVSPWLMVLDNYRGIITFIDPTKGDRYFVKKPQKLKGDCHIYCSRYGWLLMYQIGGPMVFYNPFTSDVIELPREVPYLLSFCFSAPPTSPDCMVVGFTGRGDWPVIFHFVSRDSLWYTLRLNFGGDDPCTYRFPTFVGRDVYALCNNKGLDVFRDMTEDDYTWKVFVDEAPISGCTSPVQYFLANCDQHFLLVLVSEFGESVEVFKVNDSTEEWEKIDGLGKHMIYISDTSCICLEAKSPEMENKIYFPRLCNSEGMKIVFYSLETCRYHTFRDKRIQESFSADLFGTKHHCCPHTWIEPSWS